MPPSRSPELPRASAGPRQRRSQRGGARVAVGDLDDHATRLMVEVNLFGVVHGMRLALPGMLERGRGHIVTAATRREYADRGVSITAVLPSAVDTALASGLDMRPIPKVKPEEIANAVVGSVSSRKAEVAVPSYVGGLAALATVTPEPLLNSVRRLVRDDRALRPDSDERADYQARLEAQRHGRADG